MALQRRDIRHYSSVDTLRLGLAHCTVVTAAIADVAISIFTAQSQSQHNQSSHPATHSHCTTAPLLFNPASYPSAFTSSPSNPWQNPTCSSEQAVSLVYGKTRIFFSPHRKPEKLCPARSSHLFFLRSSRSSFEISIPPPNRLFTLPHKSSFFVCELRLPHWDPLSLKNPLLEKKKIYASCSDHSSTCL